MRERRGASWGGRVGLAGGGGYLFLVVVFLPLGARGGVGVWRFLLGGGVWVGGGGFSLVASRVVVGCGVGVVVAVSPW